MSNIASDTATAETKAITAQTAVSVGMLIVLLGTVYQGSSWATRMEEAQAAAKVEQRHATELLELKIDQVRSDINSGLEDRFRRSDAVALHASIGQWRRLLGAQNPELNIPEWPELPGPE